MAKREKKYYTVTIYPHGCLWWIVIGWWWRPIMFVFMAILCGLTLHGLKVITYK